MNFEFMTIDTPLPPCMPFPRALTGFPVSSTAKVCLLYTSLLKLYLKSLKNGGKLQLDEHIPYTAQMIATLTRHQIGTVERALEIFRQLGLVEQLDSGAFYMTDIELMIGQSSTCLLYTSRCV